MKDMQGPKPTWGAFRGKKEIKQRKKTQKTPRPKEGLCEGEKKSPGIKTEQLTEVSF